MAFDKILSISSRLDTAKVEFRANIITNGSLLREDIIEKLPSLHLTHIQISLDGLSHEHDKTRHYKNGQPSFVDIESGIKRLLSNTAIKVSLRVGVDNTHPKSYLDVYTYMKKKFPKAVENGQLQIGANVIQDRTGFDNGSNCFSDRQLYEKDLFDFENENVRQFRPSLPGLNMPCMYKTPASLAIDSHGFIYPCLEYLGNPSKSIGNVIKGELSFSKQANLLFNDSVFDDKVCLSCNVFPICGGGCPKDRENHKDSPKTYCTYLKTYLADLLPYLKIIIDMKCNMKLFACIFTLSMLSVLKGYAQLRNDTIYKKVNLTEVSVMGNRPIVKDNGSLKTVIVKGTMLAEMGSLNDVLRATPGLIMKGEKQFEVIGKGTPKYYIDGKEVTKQDVLSTIRSNNIAKIEIESEPSAKYPVGTEAVINVVTIKPIKDMISLNLGESMSFKRKYSNNPSLSFLMKKDFGQLVSTMTIL